VSARASCVPLLDKVSSDRGCCPFERPLGMGESQSAGWSAEAVSRCGTNEGEAECSRVVEAAGTTLTAHKMGRYGRGRARRIPSEASITHQKNRGTPAREARRFSKEGCVQLTRGSLRPGFKRYLYIECVMTSRCDSNSDGFMIAFATPASSSIEMKTNPCRGASSRGFARDSIPEIKDRHPRHLPTGRAPKSHRLRGGRSMIDIREEIDSPGGNRKTKLL